MVFTLCLSVMAQTMEIVKGSDSTYVASLVGFVTRLAATIKLHRKMSLLPNLSPFEAKIRKRIQATV